MEKKNHQQQVYDEIVHFYDLSEQLLDSVYQTDEQYAEAHLDVIEPLITQIGKSADILTKEYADFIKSGKDHSIIQQTKLEEAFRELFAGIEICRSKIEIKQIHNILIQAFLIDERLRKEMQIALNYARTSSFANITARSIAKAKIEHKQKKNT